MLHIVFEYADEMSHWEWRRQECHVSSVDECRRIYGLYRDQPVEYRFISIEEEENHVLCGGN